MSLNTGDQIDLAIEKPAAGGRMLARHEGRVILVQGGIPGERVRARVGRVERQLAFADTIDVLQASADRRSSDADLSCGGCLYAHIGYERQRALKSEVVGHAFRHGFHPEHTERLAAYWAEALGGPTTFSDTYGDESSVVRIHSGNGEHDDMDQRAIACFDQALQDIGLDRDERLRQVLHDYFAWATTTTMAQYHDSAADVAAGLTIPHWSWDGLVG